MSRRVIALVLAAGQSRRMGRLKQLLPYRDGTILEAVLDAVDPGLDRVLEAKFQRIKA